MCRKIFEIFVVSEVLCVWCRETDGEAASDVDEQQQRAVDMSLLSSGTHVSLRTPHVAAIPRTTNNNSSTVFTLKIS